MQNITTSNAFGCDTSEKLKMYCIKIPKPRAKRTCLAWNNVERMPVQHGISFDCFSFTSFRFEKIEKKMRDFMRKLEHRSFIMVVCIAIIRIWRWHWQKETGVEQNVKQKRNTAPVLCAFTGSLIVVTHLTCFDCDIVIAIRFQLLVLSR